MKTLLKRIRRYLFMLSVAFVPTLGYAAQGSTHLSGVKDYNEICVANTLQQINELQYVIENVELTKQKRWSYRWKLQKMIYFLK